jgi:hypothetical protein
MIVLKLAAIVISMPFVLMNSPCGRMDGKLRAKVLVRLSIMINIAVAELTTHLKLARALTGLSTIRQFSNKHVPMPTVTHMMINLALSLVTEVPLLAMKLFSVLKKSKKILIFEIVFF